MKTKKTLAELMREIERDPETRTLTRQRDMIPTHETEEPARFAIRVMPGRVRTTGLTLQDYAMLFELPRVYEWTVVPGPDMVQ